jgi:lipoic acid synthetase
MEKRRPSWLKVKVRIGKDFRKVENILKKWKLNTICREALCPNIGECFNLGTATFLILGDSCTRSCSFCGVKKGNPLPPDPEEPERLARAVSEIGLNHVVITSVTRDDLPDGGASNFAHTIWEVKKRNPFSVVEVLIPDLKGSKEALTIVLDSSPDILGHNLETVPRLYNQVRRGANYIRSLELLKMAKQLSPSLITKSGLMLGLGERRKSDYKLWPGLWDEDKGESLCLRQHGLKQR